MPAGRPSKYEENFCNMLITHMAQGYSFESFGAIIDVHRDTLYEWLKKHEEFSDAKKRAHEHCLFWWEQLGRHGAMGLKTMKKKKKDGTTEDVDISRFNAAMWIYNMKCRFKDGWRDDTNFDSNIRPIKLAYDPSKRLITAD